MRAFLIGAMCFLTLSCMTSAQTPQFVFVSEQNQTTYIEGFAVNSNGSLTPVSGNPFPERQNPTALAVNPAGTFLFVANQSESNISVFAIQGSGALVELPASPFSASDGISPTALGVDQTGKFLYVANAQSVTPNAGLLDVYSIAANGALTPTGNYSLPEGAAAIFVHPTGRWLYVLAGQQSGIVQGFTIGAAGVLAPMTAYGFNYLAAPRALAGNSAGTFLFVTISQQGVGYIESLAVNPLDGSLVDRSTWTGQGDDVIQTEAVDSTGSILFGNAATFSISAGGVLNVIGNFSSGPPIPIAASQISPFLYEGQLSVPYGLFSYLIGIPNTPTFLTNTSGSPYPLAGIPTAIAVTGQPPVPSQPALTFTPPADNFPTPQPIGFPVQGSIGINNTGFGPLAISDIEISGGNGAFSQTNSCPTSLASGASCVAEITFTPSTIGAASAMLNITGSVNGSAALSGVGVEPYPIVSFSASSLTFPLAAIGVVSAPQTVIVTNLARATAALQISSVGISGANPTDFSQTNNCTTVAIGAPCSITVTFDPLAVGDRAATLLLATNANGGTYAFPLTGEGASGTPPPNPPPATQYQMSASVVGPGNVTPVGASFVAGYAVQVTAVPTGTATFSGWSGGECAGSTALICSFSMPAANVHLVATFTAALPPAPSANITATPNTQTGNPGGQFTYALTSTGFSSAPTITATCSIPKGSCLVSGMTVVVNTTAPSAAAVPSGRWLLPLGLFVAGLLCVPRRRRKTVLCMGALALLVACGGASSKLATVPPAVTAGTPVGSYTVQLSASAGSTKATAVAQLVIQ